MVVEGGGRGRRKIIDHLPNLAWCSLVFLLFFFLLLVALALPIDRLAAQLEKRERERESGGDSRTSGQPTGDLILLPSLSLVTAAAAQPADSRQQTADSSLLAKINTRQLQNQLLVDDACKQVQPLIFGLGPYCYTQVSSRSPSKFMSCHPISL